LKGEKLEDFIKGALEKGKGPLNGYKIVRDLDNCVKVGLGGKRRYEIDLCGELKETNGKRKKGKVGLAVEVKNWKDKKIPIGEARRFVQAMATLKKEKRYRQVVAIYVSQSGFTKPAQKYLQENNIKLSKPDEFEKSR